MAISLVQTFATGSANTGTITGTLASNTTAGNILIMGIGATQGTAHFGTVVKSINDTQGNTWQLGTTTTTGTKGVDIWYAANIAGGTFIGTVITNNLTSSAPSMIVREYSGVVTLNPFDVGAQGTGSSNTLNSGTTATTAQAVELCFLLGFVSAGGLTVDATYSHGTTNAANNVIAAGDLITSSTGQQFGTFHDVTNELWASAIATFKAAAGAAPAASYKTLLGAGNI